MWARASTRFVNCRWKTTNDLKTKKEDAVFGGSGTRFKLAIRTHVAL